MGKIRRKIAVFAAALLLACAAVPQLPVDVGVTQAQASIKKIPKYNGSAYTVINNNNPEFSSQEKENTTAFETYSDLDKLGRCGVAYANICKEIMPTEKRGSISAVHPSGWQSNMGWERCHLIGFQLAGENANEKNLITGTHYFNVTGMLPFENMVDDYVDETGNHVLYRVTPYFEGKNLIASGVQMEAWSVEDDGEGICFNVYVFNVQPGSTIDYAAGGVKKGNNKVGQYIQSGNYSHEYKTTELSKKPGSFKIGCTAQGKLTYSRVNGSSQLSVSKNGKVTVKKGTPAGTYRMKVKIKAAKTSVYKAKAISKTITVTVTGSNDSTDGGSSDDSADDSSEDSSANASDNASQNAAAVNTTTNTTANTSNNTASGTTGNTNYILNTNTKVFHYPTCSSVKLMSEKNKQDYTGTRNDAIAQGYKSCGRCNP